MSTLTKGQIVAAADFWYEKLLSPTFDMGENSASNLMASGMTKLLVGPFSTSKSDFTEIMLGLMDNLCEGYDSNLNVDYEPNRLFSKILESAGISSSNAPGKTQLWFSGGCVSVSEGYAAPDRCIYNPKEVK